MADPIETAEVDDLEAEALLADAAAPDDDGNRPGANREAASYRRRLREIETERDTLRSQLQAAHRREVEQLAARHLENPADLWHFGSTLDDLLDPGSGGVSSEHVAATVELLLADRPYLRRGATAISPDHDQGRKSGTAPPPSFAEFLRGATQ